MDYTRLKIGKNEFPFKATEGLKELVKEAHVSLNNVSEDAPRESKRFAFLAVKAACRDADIDFSYTWNEFINFVEPDCCKKAEKLAGKMQPKSKVKRPRRKVVSKKTTKEEQSKATASK